MSDFDSERLWELSLRRELGVLTASELAELEDVLRASPAARAQYLEWTQDAAGLHSQAHDEGDEPASVATAVAMPRSGRTGRVLLAWAMGVAAALVLVWLGSVRNRAPAGDPVASPGALVEDRAVAILASSAGASWDGKALLKGARVRSGELRLAAGYAQLEFYSGASVVLEGPAVLIVEDAMACRLESGRLHAEVPMPATGFRVETPAGTVVDLGTEFGVLVSAGGLTEVHVIRGAVAVSPANGETVRRGDGEAWRFDGAGVSEAVAARPHEFLAADDLAGMVRRDTAKQLARWRAHSETLRRDPATLVYFDFEDQLPWERRLANRAEGTVGDGAIVGAEWVSGRFEGKQALQLSKVSDRIHLTVPGEYDAMTLAAWVRFDSFDHWLSSLLLTEQWSRGDVHWHVTWDGECILGIGELGREKPHHNFYTGPQVITSEDRGRWLHLACTYNPELGEVRQFLDGKLVEREPILYPRKLRIGKAAIGNWADLARAQRDVRQINGAIDEFVMLSRAMSDDEVAAMYAAGSADR